MAKEKKKKALQPAQQQDPPGLEAKMFPKPEFETPYPGSDRLKGKVSLITGGDSGIGRAVAIAFAKEGADVAIVHLKEEERDALETAEIIQTEYNRECLLIACDLAIESNCIKAVEHVIKRFKQLDILVNNAAVQYDAKSLLDISSEQLMRTFSVNILAMFWLTKAALPHLKKGSTIINTASVTAYRGSPHLLDYSSTKGAIVTFTRSLSGNLVEQGIRVNAVAPGPVWTPLIPSSLDKEAVKTFGSDSPMKRPGQPSEIAPAYVFLACEDSSFMTGQVIHVNGGEIINSWEWKSIS